MKSKMQKALSVIKKRLASRKFSSEKYWGERYSTGGNSGAGSYNHLARFKADVLNEFVASHGVKTIIEFGCGDGNQLKLAAYPSYVGYDPSAEAVAMCASRFGEDPSKQFHQLRDYDARRAELTLSLDVIFHLVENKVFKKYMRTLFEASDRYVIIYSSDFDAEIDPKAPHVRHRRFSDWISRHARDWALVKKIENKFPYDGDYQNTSFCDFYVFEKRAGH